MYIFFTVNVRSFTNDKYNINFMEIKVLGTGCAGCKSLHETVIKAVEELKLDVSVVKEEDMIKIMSYNVMRLPGLVIDGKVISSGRNLSLADVKEILTGYTE